MEKIKFLPMKLNNWDPRRSTSACSLTRARDSLSVRTSLDWIYLNILNLAIITGNGRRSSRAHIKQTDGRQLLHERQYAVHKASQNRRVAKRRSVISMIFDVILTDAKARMIHRRQQQQREQNVIQQSFGQRHDTRDVC